MGEPPEGFVGDVKLVHGHHVESLKPKKPPQARTYLGGTRVSRVPFCLTDQGSCLSEALIEVVPGDGIRRHLC